MADTVNTQILLDGPRHTIVKVSALSDGTGLSNSQILDLSALSPPPDKLVIEEVWFAVQGYEAVLLETDRTTDHVFVRCSGDGYFDFREYGGVVDKGTGDTGDLLMTTVGTPVANDTFDITVKVRKKFN